MDKQNKKRVVGDVQTRQTEGLEKSVAQDLNKQDKSMSKILKETEREDEETK